jgi:hypothetical protein
MLYPKLRFYIYIYRERERERQRDREREKAKYDLGYPGFLNKEKKIHNIILVFWHLLHVSFKPK